MDKYEKKYDSAVSETETDIRKLTDLLLKVGTQQFLETLSPYITGGEILFDGDDGRAWKFTFDLENKSWQQKCGTESFTDQMMIHELEQKGYEIRKKGGTVINKKAGKSCAKRKIVQISNASSELIKATIQEKHMSYRGLAKLTGMNVSVISHMCAGTQKRFNEKTIQKLESVLEISIPDISNDAEAIIKDMEEEQTI